MNENKRSDKEIFKLKDDQGNILRNNRSDIGLNGMVATAKFESSKIGVEIIKQGGNAFDAAVAVGFALGVCEPNASGLGGGGFMNVKLSGNPDPIFIDFREIAPKGAKPSMWKLDDQGQVINNQRGEGGKSICIPGEVAGLLYVHEVYGVLSRDEVMAPAIQLAEDGFEITEGLFRDMTECESKLKLHQEIGNPYIGDFKLGETFVNRPLAKTLKEIQENGCESFYKGAIAKQIAQSVQKHDGVMTVDDLDDYKVKVLKPVKGSYRGYEIISSPLPSSGGTHIIQILNILENFNVSEYEINSPEYIHLMSEAFKMSFADRQEYMGDPTFTQVPIDGLTSKTYGKKLAMKIDGKSACSFSHDFPEDIEPTDTTHYSIADHDGNMVSVTKTISAFFGSGVVPENTGIVLNCQARGFVVGEGKANSIGPHKKPLSSMSPTIILKDDKPFAVLGSPGGQRIITAVAQVISKLIDHELSIEDAINSPRISNGSDEKLLCEGRLPKNVITELISMKHEVEVLSEYDRKFGGVQGIKINENGSFEGAADPRRDGMAIGY